MKLAIMTDITIGTLTGCASITNDAYVPIACPLVMAALAVARLRINALPPP